ncbi:iron-containing alcohol dehydrogenase family protein [Natrinema caseinilyticum]|uniref:iron-containing alcohol dehydrogenase family protein n=1 Tax=Natrinema caseinilyticum TaxID=2961570 RepID=UPI0020C4C664|nr:iron-containing alcohol dehydrogenase family protein [Natrinema caseinilyticum]
MFPIAEHFEYEYRGCDIVYGRGCAARLSEYLDGHGLERTLLVCGSNVGANDDLMEPIRDGLGDRLVGVFDRTTGEKRAETVFDAIDSMRETDADVLVGVGGGSSLDVARQTSVIASDGRSLTDLREEARDGSVATPESNTQRRPVIVIPTTFAGADVSDSGSITIFSADDSPTNQPIRVSGSEMPIADFADPSLFETTPPTALGGSAMNGFDKGIETLYARDANPVSDGVGIHGLRLLSDALPQVAGEGGNSDVSQMDRAVVGSLLVQIDRKVSIVHAFGHGFARRYPVQQGAIHAIVVPHVLRYLFAEVDASRALMATALGIDTSAGTDAEVGESVIDAIVTMRDAFDVPTRLRDLSATREEDLPAIAEFIVDDPPMARTPTGLDPSAEDIESVLREAW